jgi:hypothetical protein
MKATLEFTLPEDQQEHYDAINGSTFKYCLQEMDGQLRGWRKYGHQFKDAEEALEKAREYLHQLIHDNDIVIE